MDELKDVEWFEDEHGNVIFETAATTVETSTTKKKISAKKAESLMKAADKKREDALAKAKTEDDELRALVRSKLIEGTKLTPSEAAMVI